MGQLEAGGSGAEKLKNIKILHCVKKSREFRLFALQPVYPIVIVFYTEKDCKYQKQM